MKPLVLLMTAIFFAALAGPADCDHGDPSDTRDFTGTVRWQTIEGGFWGLVADDGHQYEPINLPRSLQRDGLRVRVRAKIRSDMASIRMFGEIIEILEIAPLGAQRPTPQPRN